MQYQRSAHTSGQTQTPTTRRGPPGSLAFAAPSVSDVAPHALSPFSETGPKDSPFGAGGPRRATVPSGSSGFSSGPIFAAPFGGATVNPRQDDPSPSSEQPSMNFNNSPFGNASPFGQPPANAEQDEPVIPSYALGRRTSVSAESLVPANQRSLPPGSGLETTLEEDEETPNPTTAMPSFPKSEEQLQRIKAAIKPNFLFRNLDEEQERDVLAAMKEIKIGAGEMIIEQGAAGDYFYVVESGTLEVFVKKDGQVLDQEKGDRSLLGKKVATCVEGNSFGELALMHK